MHTLKYAVKIVLLTIFLNISVVSVASADISDITDISTVINVGIKYQQKQVLMDYMRDIMEKSNMDCNTIDTGCIDNFGI